ncbi:MAG: hypothetical protein IPK16_20075 [Anaerolineales bacterium]|nr:hypothetical protein [Anaerolineales bacterium]
MDAGAIRQALRTAAVGAEEELMATWLDERYEEGKQVGKQEWLQLGRTEEARGLP